MARQRPGAGPTGAVQDRKFITGTQNQTLDLKDLGDVVADTAQDGDILQRDGAGYWNAIESPFPTKKEVGDILTTISSGLAHGVAVLGFVNDPPSVQLLGVFHIVGTAPTGAFQGKANHVVTWRGDSWEFIHPVKGETHLVESEKSLFAWNDTAWVKVASATVAGGLQSKVFTASIADTPATPVILDFGSDTWTSARLTGNLEIRNGPTHLVFNLLGADNTPKLLAAGCAEACIALFYSRNVESRNTKENIMFSGDDYMLTWLPGPGYSTNDRASSTSHCYPSVDMRFQYFYDGYLVINTRISYKSFSGLWYCCDHTFAVNNSSKNAQKLILKPRENARIAFNGLVTFQ